MKAKTILALFACSLVAVACGKDNDSGAQIARAIQGTAENNQGTSQELSQSGSALSTGTVSSLDVMAENSQKSADDIIAILRKK